MMTQFEARDARALEMKCPACGAKPAHPCVAVAAMAITNADGSRHQHGNVPRGTVLGFLHQSREDMANRKVEITR